MKPLYAQQYKEINMITGSVIESVIVPKSAFLRIGWPQRRFRIGFAPEDSGALSKWCLQEHFKAIANIFDLKHSKLSSYLTFKLTFITYCRTKNFCSALVSLLNQRSFGSLDCHKKNTGNKI